MKGLNSIPPRHQSPLVVIKRQFPRILTGFLILGFTYATLFVDVGEAHGQGNNTPNTHKPPTNTDKPPKPTDTPIIPTNPPVVPTNTPFIVPTDTLIIVPTDTLFVPTGTPVSSDTPDQNSTQTSTPDCTFGATPTATGTPLPTCTPTPTSTETAYPGGPSSTPRPPKTLAPTNTAGVTGTQMTSADGRSSNSTSAQGMIGASVTTSLTPTSNAASFPGPRISIDLNPKTNLNGLPYLLYLAALAMGGGAFFAFIVQGRKAVYAPSMGGGAAATMAINPATVGASGFSAWLAEQAPLLTYGEEVVLSKVGNGIGSALHLSGRISDLTKISERGPQEFLQLTTGPRLLPA